MPLIDQAVEASKELREKIMAGGTPSAEEYATAINLQNQLANQSDLITMLMTVGIIKSMSVSAEGQGYTVTYDQASDTFTVTKGGC